ncbi:transglutaminase domain-containing protein [Candidatus Curtissbacteria bacterium]|nr:transglutaminase domain-containing protein [Candidatus Curtissbacteria bacterium]
MKLLLKLPFGLLFTFLFYLLFVPKLVLAQGEFETTYKVFYQIEPAGRTNVTQEIVLKNKTSNYYADSFELKLGSIKVENVKAADNVGPMATDVKFDNNGTIISVKFNQKVIGLEKTLPWTLSYTSSELVSKSGQIWEVSIPRLAKSGDIAGYEASVSVPQAFGPPAFTLPTPKSQAKQGLFQTFTFDKEQLIQTGISMSFGEKQVFQFTLTYYLENSGLTAKFDEITLPPDNNYQKVVLESIDPLPTDVTVDEDGNFLAKYKLAPKEKINIAAQGYVEVFSKPFRNIDKPLTEEERKRYIQPDRYWEVDAAAIRDKAGELKTPQEIYKFVSNYLAYSEERLNKPKLDRLGALAALNSPKEAVCMEFTDLFIALARSANIPAKEVVGFAYTQNSRLRPLSLITQGDLLHAWPAYWDDNLGWVHIDPTWGSTSGGLDFFNKLDFNHITLAQRGLSSTNPPPAGAYKKKGEADKKDVIISFAQDLPQGTSVPELSFEIPNKIIAGIPVKANAQIRNVGSTSILGGKMSLESKNL